MLRKQRWRRSLNASCYTSTKSWRGYIFTAVCLCVSLCVCMCLSVCVSTVFLWTKFQPNGCTDLNADFAKWLLPAIARTLMILVTLGKKSRSQWRNTHFFLHNSFLTSLKVKGHRRGGVCVLWMLLVCIVFMLFGPKSTVYFVVHYSLIVLEFTKQ